MRAAEPGGLDDLQGVAREKYPQETRSMSRGRKRREIWRDGRSVRDFWILVSDCPYHVGPFCDYQEVADRYEALDC